MHAVPKALAVLCVLLPTLAGPGSAQQPAARTHCFESAPLPYCRNFLLTEFSGAVRVAANRDDARGTLFDWKLGAMRNAGARTALGGAVFLTWSESFLTAGVQPRLRIWADSKLSFDLAPGLIVFQGGSRNLGVHGQVAANYGRFVSLVGTLQVTDVGAFTEAGEKLRRSEWFLGARLSGRPGVVTGIAAPILTFIGYLVLYGGSSD
jgi:hypothetical protein